MSKWYVHYDDEEKRRLQYEVHKLVNSREAKFTNFVEFRNHKVVYRRYAGLYFCVCCHRDDNDLAMLEAIHCFVEVLDAYFSSVCELDLVFNFHRVYLILDEVFLAGEIMDTCKENVLATINEVFKMV
jgi:Clathrin adaptor complex small chain